MKPENMISNDSEVFLRNINYEKMCKDAQSQEGRDTVFDNFCKHGVFIKNNQEISISNLNVLKLQEKENVFYYLDDINSSTLDKKYKILKIVPFKDTTIIQKIYNTYKNSIHDNKLIMTEELEAQLKGYIANWDERRENFVCSSIK